ncbi:MAG: geranylgeranylglyceryl/heptaprenylglyceryl phosphate synthase [Bacteroidetes bacterium B1(2017)]|nr:MAG: geranylgeranylglyceryl/heptaprenylglyceryl phosphate synthase [Bacteroidetes bacterium B1(2017)]
MKTSFYLSLSEKIQKGVKQLAVLIDPDSLHTEEALLALIENCNKHQVDIILVGGSLITNGFWDRCIELLKANTKIPVVLFPGNIMQTHKAADAILFLSMISGRNPDLLIGKHVLAAPLLKKSGIEVIPTGYMIVDGGNITSVMYMSNTTPLPSDKNNIAACTALAGEMLGLKVIYMDAGSGAKNPISASMISEVKSQITGPLFIGGGIRTPEQAIESCKAGADIVVVGNAIEKDPSLVGELVAAIHSLNN